MTKYSIEEKGVKSDILALPVFEGELEKTAKSYDADLSAHLSKAMQKDFGGKKGQKLLLYGGEKYPRLLLVGLGEKKSFDLKNWKKSVGSVVILAQGKKVKNLSLVVNEEVIKKLGAKVAGQETTVAAELAMYAFDDHKGKDEKVVELEKVNLITEAKGSEKRQLQKGIEDGFAIAEGTNLVRKLGNTPPSIMTPTLLAKKAEEMCKGNSKLKIKVFSRPEMKKMGMGCLLGVSSGSAQEPKFVVVEYKNASKENKPTVLVGKGITFDSGGLHIKPDAYMTEMKFDMLGAATVLGVIKAASLLGLKKNIVGIIPTCENMPDGESYRPDDILTAMNGKTVEIVNTDAEGRVILADGLSYATAKYQPKELIDFATLTGACMVAVGMDRTGLFGTDEKLVNNLLESSDKVSEQLWRLPLGEEFSEDIKSDVADIKNIGTSRYGGASTAAAFLQFFTQNPKTGKTEYPWAHFDLSSSYYKGKGKPWMRGGSNGFGVQTVIEYLR